MKLIDLLVKELPQRGGWPEGAINATQDKDGEVCFSSGAIPEFGYAAWEGGDWCGNEFHTIRASDYDTAIITREQYEAALAASDGWIEWAGGDCPVDSDAIVEVKFRWHNQHQYNNDRAGDFDWAHAGSSSDIIAYRVHQPTKSEQVRADAWRSYAGVTEKDDEADLNECIGQDVDIPEWNGDGLPPVGVECEFKCATGEWVAVEITAIARNGMCFVERGKNGENYVSFSGEFRPLCTEEERKREAAAKEMARYANSDQHRKFNAGLRNCLSIYDAIAAGKIPGVKLEGK